MVCLCNHVNTQTPCVLVLHVLQASGAGDGAVRLWAVNPSTTGGAPTLSHVGSLPTRGFVNGLAIGRSGRVVLAATGQEPRLGRWVRDGGARNGLVVHRLGLNEGNQ